MSDGVVSVVSFKERVAFLRGVRGYVKQYREDVGRDVSLSVLNRRWGIECRKKFACRLGEMIGRYENLFRVTIGANGGSVIQLREAPPLVEVIRGHMVKAPELKLTRDALLECLKGSGYTLMDFMDSARFMVDSGSVVLEGDVYELVL